MIIFDLDGTLADCEHRRHFVDPLKNKHDLYMIRSHQATLEKPTGWYYPDHFRWVEDWKAFYEACYKDKKGFVMSLFDFIGMNGQSHNLQIWSGRCESVKEKTKAWLRSYSFAYACHEFDIELKMRPLGDNTPDDVLKEKWLDEAIAQGKTINFVFDDRKKVRDMWIRRGIFVFDVSQGKGDF